TTTLLKRAARSGGSASSASATSSSNSVGEIGCTARTYRRQDPPCVASNLWDMTRVRTLIATSLALLVAGLAVPAGAASHSACSERVLIVSAMPLELNPLFEKMHW